MSQLMANNRGMKLGDDLEEQENEWIYDSYTLDEITSEQGYTAYFIDSSDKILLRNYLLLKENICNY